MWKGMKKIIGKSFSGQNWNKLGNRLNRKVFNYNAQDEIRRHTPTLTVQSFQRLNCSRLGKPESSVGFARSDNLPPQILIN